MNSYSIKILANWLNTEASISRPLQINISDLIFDSRKINSPETSLFFALVTSRNDGHRFIETLIKQGVVNFVVQHEIEKNLIGKANFIRVENTQKALQEIAGKHREAFTYPVVAITGSNGKTIVKEWANEALRNTLNIVRSPKSFNSQIGVPLSVWQMKTEHEMALFEAGISAPGEMIALAQIIHPDIGIFTNIGNAHAENFKNQEEHISEKLILFENCKALICCADHTEIVLAAQKLGIPCVLWGKNQNAQLNIVSENCVANQTHITLNWKDEHFELIIPFINAASVENALHVTMLLLYLGHSPDFICKQIRQLHSIEMRLEFRNGINGCTIINDAWSADIESLKIALDAMQQIQQHTNRTLILSDILESGKPNEVLYKEVADLIKRKGVTRFIGVGEQLLHAAHFFEIDKQFFPSTESLIQHLPSLAFKNECILLKGARIFGFERIASALQKKTHETVLEIQLSAMVHNLNFYRSKLNPGVKTMAMVKAFSYGSGSYEVANMLQFNGVDYLAVAYADEGIELRQAGISLPILVLSPEVDSFSAMIENRLEPEIYSFRMLELFSAAAMARNGFDGQALRIHIKFDTGMHRLGFEEADIPQLIDQLQATPHLETIAVFSHLAASGDSEHAAFTQEQISRFERYSKALELGLGKTLIKHLLNSSGISHYQEAQYDMVRLGIGLYGIGEIENQNFLLPVSTLLTSISQIRELNAGETVGYSRKGILNKPSRIATLPIGYADGFLRKLGNGNAKLRVHGIEAPTIGGICMDMCMIDVTNIPSAKEGDQVVIFENAQDIRALAKWLDSIPYEVLTGISERVKRIYFQE